MPALINLKTPQASKLKPLHFDSSSQPLYGVYHPPTGKNQRASSVLLCPPIGHEHMQSYWAFKQLAIRLSRMGYGVLRFDYFGTGNSAGKTIEGNITVWQNNVRSAARELQRQSGVDTQIMVGLRIGAALAAQTSRELQPEALILWDPVVSGMHYFAELSDLHQAKLDYMHRKETSTREFKGFDRLGYLYSEQLVAELGKLNLLEQSLGTILDLTLLTDTNNPHHIGWLKRLQLEKVPHQQLALQDTINWQRLKSMEAAILPGKAINTICTLLQGMPK